VSDGEAAAGLLIDAVAVNSAFAPLRSVPGMIVMMLLLLLLMMMMIR